MHNMPKEISEKPHSRMERNWSTSKHKMSRYTKILAIVSVLIMLTVIGFAVAIIGFNYDGVSQNTREKLVEKDARTVLDLGLTGETSAKNAQSIVLLSNAAWKSEISASIQHTLSTTRTVANQVNFAGKTYDKKTVMSDLANHYMQTLQTDRDYSIQKVSFDKYHNAKVNYIVTPIDLPAAQKKVQNDVDKILKHDVGSLEKLKSSQIRLVEYGMISDNWDRVLQGKVPTADKKSGQFNLLYSSQWRSPSYQATKANLNQILNTGLSE